MTRKEERQRLMLLLQAKAPALGHQAAMRLTTALLDNGHRSNRLVLEEFASYFETTGKAIGLDPVVVEQVPVIVRRYAEGLK